MKITIEISETTYSLLEVLTRGDSPYPTVKDVIEELCDHAQQGVYRPGAWERGWLIHAFGPEFEKHLEAGDPYGRDGCEQIFQRPRLV